MTDVLWSHAPRGADSPALVFENALSCDWSEWAWVRDFLEDDFDLVFTNRTWPCSPLKSRDLEIPGLGGRPFVAVGHSLGAIFAQETATEYGPQCHAVIVIEGSSREQFREEASTFTTLLWLRQHLLLQVARASLPGWAPNSDWTEGIDALPEWARERTLKALANRKHWWNAYRDLGYCLRHARDDARFRMDAVRHAVVTSASEPDRSAPKMDREGPGGRALCVSGADHGSIVMDRTYARTVADFVKDVMCMVGGDSANSA